MKPAPFRYSRPSTLDAALDLLADKKSGGKIIAGGQSLVPMMNFRMATPDLLIDINRIAGLDYHEVQNGALRIGALSRHAALAKSEAVRDASPLMYEAYQWVAHGAVRNRGTLCGNLCHADPASEMPAVALCVDAVMHLRSKAGRREVPASEFFLGVYETAKRDDELLYEVQIPAMQKGTGWGFQEMAIRKGDFAIAASCVTMQLTKGTVSKVAVAVAGCDARPVRFAEIEKHLVGKKAEEKHFAELADAYASAVQPADDIHGSEYRRDLVRALTRRALVDAQRRCA